MTEQDDRIERHGGTCVGGYMAGAGYRGKRDDQDEAVQEFARRLSGEFPHDIQIRYNTNRLGGGAWLKDGVRDAQVGLGADLTAPEWHREQFQEYLDNGLDDDLKPPSLKHMDPDELVLKFSVNMKAPVVDESVCNRMTDRDDRRSYVYRRFDDQEAAWEWFIEHVNRDEVNPPADD